MVSFSAAKATFTLELTAKQATEGDTVSLECNVSHKDAKVKWLLNGKPIEKVLQSRDYEIQFMNVSRTITLKNIRPEFAGEISCETEDGRSKTTAELVVVGRWLRKKFTI